VQRSAPSRCRPRSRRCRSSCASSKHVVALQALGAGILLLLWLFVMANVIVFGAEVNWWVSRKGREEDRRARLEASASRPSRDPAAPTSSQTCWKPTRLDDRPATSHRPGSRAPACRVRPPRPPRAHERAIRAAAPRGRKRPGTAQEKPVLARVGHAHGDGRSRRRRRAGGRSRPGRCTRRTAQGPPRRTPRGRARRRRTRRPAISSERR